MAEPSQTLSEYPFPLRPGLRVWMRIPDDLTVDEAERLAAFVRSLAQDGETTGG